MSLEDTIKFYEKILDPDFVKEQAELSTLIASEDEPDKVAKLASERMGLHFTGSELLQFGEEIRAEYEKREILPSPPAAEEISMEDSSVAASKRTTMPQRHQKGASFPGLSPAASIALKSTLITLAETMKRAGKSKNEIMIAWANTIERVTGTSKFRDQIMSGKLTGKEWLDLPIKSALSAVWGMAEDLEDTGKKVIKIIGKIFSGW